MIDAVGMEAHGAPLGKLAQNVAGVLPDAVAEKVMAKVGVDRLSVLHAAIDSVRRGGTISLSGVYCGMLDPLPMMELFDKQIQLRMGQANVRRWIDEILPLVEDDEDPLGVEDLATHRLPLEQARLQLSEQLFRVTREAQLRDGQFADNRFLLMELRPPLPREP